MRTELIITTYESPHTLVLTLESVLRQEVMPDILCIADDGSGPETAAVIAEFEAAHPEIALRHVWHEDDGFQRSAILNRAIATSDADLLIVIDGDVLIHPVYVARHVELARPGRFCTGSLIRLDAEASKAVTVDLIRSGELFTRDWLRANRAFDRVGSWLKAMPFPKAVMNLFDVTSPVRRALTGANSSAWRRDLLAVNGYDEGIKYGGQDKEIGLRMNNNGVRGRHLRFTAPLIHLDHPRGYADPEKMARQKAHIREVRRSGQVWTEDGIVKGKRPA